MNHYHYFLIAILCFNAVVCRRSIPPWILAKHNMTEEQFHGEIVDDKTFHGLTGITSGISGIWNWIFGSNSGAGGGTTGGTVTETGNKPTVIGTSGSESNEAGDVSNESGSGTSSDQYPYPTCDCRCGVVNTKNRIVGGTETKINQYPWMAMLSYDNRFYCGGALINNLYILTAAHCVDGFTVRRIKIRLLEHDRNIATESKVIHRGVSSATVHPRYNQNTFNNDIAVLKLDQEVKYSNDIRPVCLPEKGKRFTGEIGTVLGWGKLGESKPVSNVLREVQVPIMSNIKCSGFYGSSQITDNMLCAGYKDGGKDSCQGDSGGPLHIKNSSYHLAGLVSWGEGCSRPNNPGVYARVNRYLSWITSVTDGTCFCTPS